MTSLSNSFLDKPTYSIEVQGLDGNKYHLADPKSTRAMLALMNMEAVLGGAASHWGGPSAFAELVSSLMALVFKEKENWNNKYHIVNDAGHCENGIYAIKVNYKYNNLTLEDLRKFRSIESPLAGHGEFHLFPEGVYLSNGPLGSTVAQAQGLCLADYLQKKNRMTIVLASDGGLMEGEAKEALASIPGWHSKGKMNPFLLVVSNNNTKLSGRIDKDSFSMSPTFSSLKALGWHTVTLENPHDLKSAFHTMQKCINLAWENKKPVLLEAQTTKGYGVHTTISSESGGHGFPLKKTEELENFLKEIYETQEIPKELISWKESIVSKPSKQDPPLTSKIVDDFYIKRENHIDSQLSADLDSNKYSLNEKKWTAIPKEKVQVGISKALIEKKEEGFPIVSVSSDLQGSTGVLGFRNKYPELSFDVGVAEANMISVATGLSKQGFIPVVDTFAQFAVTKGALPLFMASLSESPVIAFLSHVGFQDAADGASHQCLTYIAQTGSIPNTKIFTLSSSTEADSLTKQAIDEFKQERKNIIFFLGRENFPKEYTKAQHQLGRSYVVFSSLSKNKKSCTIISTGTLVEQSVQAGFNLVKKGWDIIVLHASIINTIDLLTLKTCLSKTQNHLLTVEDHHLRGGLSSFVAQSLTLNNIPAKVHSLGAKKPFGRSAYKAIHLYKNHGLDFKSIVQKVESVF